MKVQTNEIGELYLLIWAYTAGIKSIEKPLRRIHIVRMAGWGSAKIVPTKYSGTFLAQRRQTTKSQGKYFPASPFCARYYDL